MTVEKRHVAQGSIELSHIRRSWTGDRGETRVVGGTQGSSELSRICGRWTGDRGETTRRRRHKGVDG